MLLLFPRLLFLVLTFLSGSKTTGQTEPHRMTQVEYIEKYRNWAIEDMLKSGVPASITMAQAILESDNGNSPLAVNANNHFGIKCHDWKGAKYYHDDDAKQECFRKYNAAIESFNDHSYFLKNRQRYAFLFDLNKTDYKSWAYGLKKAGYATNPVYAEKLIELIERYDLASLDKFEKVPDHLLTGKDGGKKVGGAPETKNISVNRKSVQFHNGIKYIVGNKGESLDAIAREQGMNVWQIKKYNDLPKSAANAGAGQRLYLQPKRRKCREEIHTASTGESMYTISQRYGVKLKLLYRRNKMKPGQPIKEGQRVYLRSAKKD